MYTPPQSKIFVIGVGNTIRSDDGLGVHALHRLRMHARTPRDVVCIDGGTIGLELASYVWGASRLLLIDSVDAGQPAGTLIRMDGNDLRNLPGGITVHQLGITDLVASLSLACEEPPDIVLLGVQPASTDWGTSLTANVQAAVAPLVEVAIEILEAWRRETAVHTRCTD